MDGSPGRVQVQGRWKRERDGLEGPPTNGMGGTGDCDWSLVPGAWRTVALTTHMHPRTHAPTHICTYLT
jgi:hypothetical protein